MPERVNLEAAAERMREDWNRRAREDAHYYVAFGGRDQDEESFLATASDVLGVIEAQLNRLAPGDCRARRALEIGCGPGRLMKPLSRHFGEIHGVDVADEMVRLARERLRGVPHAHVHAGAAGLPQFASASFDFIYSYAVYQHIPSREVVLEYMRETVRALRPGGIFQGQFNGLPQAGGAGPNTWSGVSFTAEDIRAFTRGHGVHLLALEGAGTQYMWTTWRKPAALDESSPAASPAVRRITNARTGEPLAPNAGRHAALAIWATGLPPHCDLNTLEVYVDGQRGAATHIGGPLAGGVQQINAALPAGTRTGLVPVELRLDGAPMCAPVTARVVPAAPLVPRIVSVTDGVNLVQQNRSTTGLLKVHLEEAARPEQIAATVGGFAVRDLEFLRTDPLPPRYELNFRLPEGLAPGPHPLVIRIGSRALLPWTIEADFAAPDRS